jgi:hypothetical protein
MEVIPVESDCESHGGGTRHEGHPEVRRERRRERGVTRLHAVVKASAPVLTSRLWYGMPAYAKAGKVVCFFQSSQKFKTRYSTLGFSDQANLDEGAMWPVAFALTDLTEAEEQRIGELVRRAVG